MFKHAALMTFGTPSLFVREQAGGIAQVLFGLCIARLRDARIRRHCVGLGGVLFRNARPAARFQHRDVAADPGGRNQSFAGLP